MPRDKNGWKDLRACGAYRGCAYYAEYEIARQGKRLYVCGNCWPLYRADGWRITARHGRDGWKQEG